MQRGHLGKRLFVISFVLILLSTVMLANISFLIHQISFSDATYQMQGKEPVPFTMPFFRKGETEFVTVEFTMHLPLLFPYKFRLVPDDCIEKLTINGTSVQDNRVPYCPHYNIGEVYDLSAYLHPGENRFHVIVKDFLGEVGLKVLPEYQKSFPIFFAKAPLYFLGLAFIFFILP